MTLATNSFSVSEERLFLMGPSLGSEADHLRIKARKDLLNLLEGVSKTETTLRRVSQLEHAYRSGEGRTLSLAKP